MSKQAALDYLNKIRRWHVTLGFILVYTTSLLAGTFQKGDWAAPFQADSSSAGKYVLLLPAGRSSVAEGRAANENTIRC